MLIRNIRPLTENVAQYKDSLYLVKYVSAVEKTLSVIHLPDPQQELQEGVNIAGIKFISLRAMM